jgi:hypothetical protein
VLPPIFGLSRFLKTAGLKTAGLCLCLVVAGEWQLAEATAQRYQQPFRMFRPDQVPTPDQLLRKLSELQTVELPRDTARQIQELGQRLLEGMSPEQRKYLQELAREFQNSAPDSMPAEWQRLADDLSRRLRQEGTPLAVEDLLQQLPESLNPPTRNSPGRSPTPQGPGEAAPQPPRFPVSPDSAAAGEGTTLPRPDRGSSGRRGEAGESPKLPVVPDPETTRKLVERLRETASRVPDAKIFQPNPEVFAPAPERSGPASGNSGESIGNRIDRMIMNAVDNQLNRSGETRSQLADAVNNMFSGVVDRLHSGIQQRDWSRSARERSRRLGRRLQAPDRRFRQSSGGGFWNVFAGRSPISTNLADWWVPGLVISLVVVAGLWLAGRQQLRLGRLAASGLPGSRRFRVPKIRDTEGLVRAVDGLLLVHFGRPSSWWHSRRAETALQAWQPALGPRIRQLVYCYEYARYSETGESLSDSRIAECREILRELAAGSSAGESADAIADTERA